MFLVSHDQQDERVLQGHRLSWLLLDIEADIPMHDCPNRRGRCELWPGQRVLNLAYHQHYQRDSTHCSWRLGHATGHNFDEDNEPKQLVQADFHLSARPYCPILHYQVLDCRREPDASVHAGQRHHANERGLLLNLDERERRLHL